MSENKNLQTIKQRRIRHIRSIAGRNIVWRTKDDSQHDDATLLFNPSSSTTSTMRRSDSSNSLGLGTTTVEDSSLMKRAYKQKMEEQQQQTGGGLLDCFFTLHTGPHEPRFYKSEMIPNTTNPTFRSLSSPFHDWMNWHEAASTMVVICFWTRHSLPESAGLHFEPELGHHGNNDDFQGEFELLIEWQLDLNALTYICKTANHLHWSFPENSLLFELEDGFYSAPDISSKATASKRVSLAESELDSASVNTENSQTKKKRSYTYNSIIKLNALKECIFDTQTSSNEVRTDIQAILNTSQDGLRLKRIINYEKSQLCEKEAHLIKYKKQLKQKRARLADMKRQLGERIENLKESNERSVVGSDDLEENQSMLEKNIKMRQQIFNTLNKRKKELIADLFSIYPIEQSYDDSQQFTIRGIYLPNSVYDGQNDERISTALGFTAHLVSMLAYYLEIPLRYPTNTMGSRSTIKDMISLIVGSKEFPLYLKGVDRYRFEFGVFLLNKNIEQLMNAYGLIVMDLRHTLPNIHYFIQAILTTSITSGPTSMSVLSISSYANGDRTPERRHRKDHNHLTLQPTQHGLPHPPSPSLSFHSPKSSVSYSSSAAFLKSAPQAVAAPTILDPVTTSSRHSTATPCGDSSG